MAETTCDKLTPAPISHPYALREKTKKIRSEVEPSKKRRVGEGVFKMWFYLSLSYSDSD